jgi:hypothetical protein
VSLAIPTSKVTSDMEAHLASHMCDDDLCAFIMMNETWSKRTFESINWHASEVASR